MLAVNIVSDFKKKRLSSACILHRMEFRSALAWPRLSTTFHLLFGWGNWTECLACQIHALLARHITDPKVSKNWWRVGKVFPAVMTKQYISRSQQGLKQSCLPGSEMKQDKMCTFLRKISFSSNAQQKTTTEKQLIQLILCQLDVGGWWPPTSN